jgi:hypothetical protein
MNKKQSANDQIGDDWDVVTATNDGGTVWRRYGDGEIIVTKKNETPQEVLARDEAEGSGIRKPRSA